jgi:galactose mutarotase-like enzyme
MITLENEFLKVSVRAKGAELTSVYNKPDNIEHLWQADPAVWAWHAPNLFPVVGACIDNKLFVEGAPYTMERHGFARQSAFSLQDSSASHALFSLTYTREILVQYPYKFEFQILYKLAGKAVSVSYRVINKDEKTMFFSLGGHPAFNVPFTAKENYADYFLEFPDDTQLTRHLLSDAGLFNGNTEPMLLDKQNLHLTKDLFAKDALVFKDLRSKEVSLRSTKHKHAIRLAFPEFSYLGIWAKPGADFVCIEPWLGCADTEGKRVDISEKEAIEQLPAGKTFEATYTIAIETDS